MLNTKVRVFFTEIKFVSSVLVVSQADLLGKLSDVNSTQAAALRGPESGQGGGQHLERRPIKARRHPEINALT